MHGLYLLYWVEEKHLPAAAVAAVLAAGDLALTGLEFPTGWFADAFGHRASLIIGSVVQIAGMLCCWLASSVPGLALAAVLVALGDAFRSGADEALLYRTCVALGREPAFQRINATARAMKQAALVGLVVAGGLIVRAWGFTAGWLLETALSTLGMIIAWVMIEPPPVPSSTAVRPSTNTSNGLSSRIALLILPGAILGALASSASFLAQTHPGSEPEGVTMLVAAIALAEAAGSAVGTRLPAGMIIQLALLATGVLTALLALVSSITVAPTIALAFLVGIADPLRATVLQRRVADGARARALSLASALDKALISLLVPLITWWRR